MTEIVWAWSCYGTIETWALTDQCPQLPASVPGLSLPTHTSVPGWHRATRTKLNLSLSPRFPLQLNATGKQSNYIFSAIMQFSWYFCWISFFLYRSLCCLCILYNSSNVWLKYVCEGMLYCFSIHCVKRHQFFPSKLNNHSNNLYEVIQILVMPVILAAWLAV